MRHRFNLQPHDLGIDSPNSFVLGYFKNACMDRSPDDLTEHENKLLGGWIRGLFESELSDELMSMCSPKEFHLLVATLFDQSLRACQAKVLALDTLRGGFECKQPFRKLASRHSEPFHQWSLFCTFRGLVSKIRGSKNHF